MQRGLGLESTENHSWPWLWPWPHLWDASKLRVWPEGVLRTAMGQTRACWGQVPHWVGVAQVLAGLGDLSPSPQPWGH